MLSNFSQLLRKFLRQFPLYYTLRASLVRRRQIEELRHWERMGKPAPPPHIIKQRTLRHYAKTFNLKILVETGTCYGDMIDAMKEAFDRIYSIELSEELYLQARRRFSRKPHIHLIWGDSGVELKRVVSELDAPALFFLDGHYSAGITAKGEKNTPIYEELNHILSAVERRHVILIDDARCFGVEKDYPSLQQLTAFIAAKRPDLNVRISDDTIRVTPPV